jgi:hypothetical protein
MRMRVQGRSIRFVDAEPKYEEVRDQWGPNNREPATDSEICRMTAEGYRSWMETGRRPEADDQQVIAGEGNYASSGTFAPGVADLEASARFSRASDARHGYRSAVTADETAGLSPAERFAQASARKWASYDPRGRVADLRRRRSE